MRESAIVAKVMKKVHAHYPWAYCRKLADRFTRGLPDIIIVLPITILTKQMGEPLRTKQSGRALFVETKTLKGKAAKLQELERDAILRAGGTHLFARDAEAVLRKLEEMGAC